MPWLVSSRETTRSDDIGRGKQYSDSNKVYKSIKNTMKSILLSKNYKLFFICFTRNKIGVKFTPLVVKLLTSTIIYLLQELKQTQLSE